MNGWFLALIIIYAIELGFIGSRHGKPEDGTHNIWITIMAVGIMLTLIYKAIQVGF